MSTDVAATRQVQVEEIIILHGQVRGIDLKKGDKVKILSTIGGQVAELAFRDYEPGTTRGFNGLKTYGEVRQILRAKEGSVFINGNGEHVLKIVEDRSHGGHDLLFPGCKKEIFQGKKPGCRDMLADTLGIPRRSLPSTIGLFMDVEDFRIVPSRSRAGDYLVLEALQEVRIGITSCADDRESKSSNEATNNPTPCDIRLTVMRSS
jgi:uncharacterized protein YcgI (DUF1989 family)